MIEKMLMACNINMFLLKTKLIIKMLDLVDNKKTNFHKYLFLFNKIIYLSYRPNLDIIFIIK